MSDLFAPVCSITATHRRRFIWAAWWSAPPCQSPFRKPDASKGGSRTREAALLEAEREAGASLIVIEDLWARAWARLLMNRPPWPESSKTAQVLPKSDHQNNAPSRWDILCVSSSASISEIKQAFRKRALETHPDHGGDPKEFFSLCQAYKKAMARRDKSARRPKPTT